MSKRITHLATLHSFIGNGKSNHALLNKADKSEGQGRWPRFRAGSSHLHSHLFGPEPRSERITVYAQCINNKIKRKHSLFWRRNSWKREKKTRTKRCEHSAPAIILMQCLHTCPWITSHLLPRLQSRPFSAPRHKPKWIVLEIASLRTENSTEEENGEGLSGTKFEVRVQKWVPCMFVYTINQVLFWNIVRIN